jgi:RNA polymerase sigma-70 factor (ECF subfamily)
MDRPTDTELWQRIAADDPNAFGLLFERHGATIHRYALRRTANPATAEDVVSLVFLEAWRRRAQVDLRQASALPWLYGVAGNVLRSQGRSRRRHAAALERLAALPEPSPMLVERQVEAAAEAATVMQQISALPLRQREVLVLASTERLSHAEIAEALGTTVGTVKSRLSRARARLDRAAPQSPIPTRLTAAPLPNAQEAHP